MATRKYISRNEAAEMCYVHPQTISNWCEWGLIGHVDRYAKKRRVRLYLKEDVEKMIPSADEIEVKTIEVEEYRKALEKEKKEVIEEIDAARRERMYQAENVNVFREIVNICKTILESYYGNPNLTINPITPREADILQEMLSMKHMWAIADKHMLSPERVRQIREKALWKVTSPENAVDVMAIIDENNSLRCEAEKARAMLSVAEERLKEYGLNKVEIEENEEMRRKLSTLISDLGVSVRLFNCLRVIDVKTLADVVSWPRMEIMRLRNFGRKSMYELELLLEKMGLEFNMEVERYGFVNNFKAYRRKWL